MYISHLESSNISMKTSLFLGKTFFNYDAFINSWDVFYNFLENFSSDESHSATMILGLASQTCSTNQFLLSVTLHWPATRQWEVWPKRKAMIPVDFLRITFPIKEGECKLTLSLVPVERDHCLWPGYIVWPRSNTFLSTSHSIVMLKILDSVGGQTWVWTLAWQLISQMTLNELPNILNPTSLSIKLG